MYKKLLQASTRLFSLELHKPSQNTEKSLGKVEFKASWMTCGGRGCNSESFMTLPTYQPSKPR
jgi:hypothetical protein